MWKPGIWGPLSVLALKTRLPVRFLNRGKAPPSPSSQVQLTHTDYAQMERVAFA